ncbi:MAG: chemotaxis-specific protein-glutamate methyltransferase CheB [Candidatus Xenobiia bacterium LiM19]
MEKIKVLIADDSELVRNIVAEVLSSDDEIEVINLSKNGKEAIAFLENNKVDVVVTDIEMPVMDGLKTIEHIMTYKPTPILAMSCSPSAKTVMVFNALELGALEVVGKSNLVGRNKEEFIKKVKLFSKVRVIARTKKQPVAIPANRKIIIPKKNKTIGIASSTGGPNILKSILEKIPSGLDARMLIVQHISKDFDEPFIEWLSSYTSIKVKSARRGDSIEPDTAFIGPCGYHITVDEDNKIQLSESTDRICPSGDVLLSSIAQYYGPNSLGIILSGMGRDGAQGIKAIKNAGGRTIAQNRETSIIFSMPESAINLNVIDQILPPEAIAEEIIHFLQQ